jgi:hypothetical protein
MVRSGSAGAIGFVILSLIAQQAAARESGESAAKLAVDRPVSLTLTQKQAQAIPGSEESLTLRIGDITGRMTLVSIRDRSSKVVLRETPIGVDEEVTFEVGSGKFGLTLSKVDDKLIGRDAGTFIIRNLKVAEAEPAKRPEPLKAKFGDTVTTGAGGKLQFKERSRTGLVVMVSGKQDFALMPGHWAWLDSHEIVKVVAASDHEVAYRLYRPVPMPRLSF